MVLVRPDKILLSTHFTGIRTFYPHIHNWLLLLPSRFLLPWITMLLTECTRSLPSHEWYEWYEAVNAKPYVTLQYHSPTRHSGLSLRELDYCFGPFGCRARRTSTVSLQKQRLSIVLLLLFINPCRFPHWLIGTRIWRYEVVCFVESIAICSTRVEFGIEFSFIFHCLLGYSSRQNWLQFRAIVGAGKALLSCDT
jgi:hypothetical protein